MSDGPDPSAYELTCWLVGVVFIMALLVIALE